jgi:hypothetical protein
MNINIVSDYYRDFFTACALFKLAKKHANKEMQIAALKMNLHFEKQMNLLDYAVQCHKKSYVVFNIDYTKAAELITNKNIDDMSERVYILIQRAL